MKHVDFMLEVQASNAYDVGMLKHQYTIRRVPERLDRLLREKARASGKSLNEVALDALQTGLGTPFKPKLNHEYDEFAGTWVEDPAFDEAMKYFDQIDKEDWK